LIEQLCQSYEEAAMELTKHRIFTLIWITSLTFLGGATNISAIMLFQTTITHHTGNISKAAIALASGDFTIFLLLLSYLALFSLGSVIAGFLFYRRHDHLRILYTLLPILLGSALLLSITFLAADAVILMVISLGMGLQNGTYFKVRGIMIRTTHMTGYLTDAAFALGAVLKGNMHELWKVGWYFASILVFFIGGMIATFIVLSYGKIVLDVIALAYIALGLFVFLFNPQLEFNWFTR
jgi:uncharacterized membrane protein YoaK (UPF0700 family)